MKSNTLKSENEIDQNALKHRFRPPKNHKSHAGVVENARQNGKRICHTPTISKITSQKAIKEQNRRTEFLWQQ